MLDKLKDSTFSFSLKDSGLQQQGISGRAFGGLNRLLLQRPLNNALYSSLKYMKWERGYGGPE